MLGPLHYLAYVNDMEHVVNNCSIYQYADDTCLVACSKNLNTAVKYMQEDFTRVSMWSHDAGLVLNAAKTKITHVRSSHMRHSDTSHFNIIAHDHDCLHRSLQHDVGCSCEAIEQVSHHTYLGLIVDNRLNWSAHIDSVCDKMRAILAKFYIIKNKMPFKILRTMYVAMAESIISYGITSYGRTFKTYIDKISILQIRLLKLIVPRNIKEQYKENIISIFEFCNILPIQDKVHMSLLIEQFNNTEIQIPVTHKTSTRKITQKMLKVPRVNNYYGRRTLASIIPTLMNSIPLQTNAINNKNYKRILKKYFYDSLKHK